MNVLGCGGPNHSGVYAEVETVLNWVKVNSGSNCGGSNPTASPTEGPNTSTSGPTEGPNTSTSGLTEGPNTSTSGPTEGPNTSTYEPTDGPYTSTLGPSVGPNTTTFGPTEGPYTSTPEGPNTSTEGGVCRVEWIGDGECDDVNNTEECQWDGGDCCGDDVATDYCTVCECLDPDFDETCKDNWSERWCRRVKRKGRCNKGNLSWGWGPIANCRKTCEHC